MELLELKNKSRAFIPSISRIDEAEAKKYIENKGIKVKKILKTELAIYRIGTYIYFKGGTDGRI